MTKAEKDYVKRLKGRRTNAYARLRYLEMLMVRIDISTHRMGEYYKNEHNITLRDIRDITASLQDYQSFTIPKGAEHCMTLIDYATFRHAAPYATLLSSYTENGVEMSTWNVDGELVMYTIPHDRSEVLRQQLGRLSE